METNVELKKNIEELTLKIDALELMNVQMVNILTVAFPEFKLNVQKSLKSNLSINQSSPTAQQAINHLIERLDSITKIIDS
ncbi:hypothetical protein [Thorsellia anophelis]|uniref:Uncharacterized protein n=1 Tax=Thorsellia anophelis DSM 18579 TaxID=1123402 RepID=A0A1I0FPK9_9GAMM|nr:hypothetical protein [Thorsellia anophelis]SET60312.1 hypothetical protein SAMN02583745_02854 [Thorsellia anophelis DSM 18579]